MDRELVASYLKAYRLANPGRIAPEIMYEHGWYYLHDGSPMGVYRKSKLAEMRDRLMEQHEAKAWIDEELIAEFIEAHRARYPKAVAPKIEYRGAGCYEVRNCAFNDVYTRPALRELIQRMKSGEG